MPRSVRRSIVALFLTMALLLPGAALAATAPGAQNPLHILAKSAVLLDARSGQVLYAYNPNLRMQPASLAKMMTFLLALEALKAGRIKLDTTVTVSKAAWELALQLGALSDMDLRVGQKVSFKDLLYGLMVSSGNDAAVAVAQALAGSQQAFIAEMNKRAAQLGLTNTHFETVHGLPAKGQYTTALDMAHLGQYIALHHPEADQYTTKPSFTWNGITQANWNLPLLKMDPRVFGIKTGHVSVAGYHLVAAARQGNQLLIGVVMGTTSDYERAVQADALLKYGFDHFDTVAVEPHRYVPASLPVWKGRAERVAIAAPGPLWISVQRGQEGKVTATARLVRPLVAPIAKGAVLGHLRIDVAGSPVRTVDLTAAKAVPRGGLLHVLWDDFRLLFARVWRHVHL